RRLYPCTAGPQYGAGQLAGQRLPLATRAAVNQRPVDSELQGLHGPHRGIRTRSPARHPAPPTTDPLTAYRHTHDDLPRRPGIARRDAWACTDLLVTAPVPYPRRRPPSAGGTTCPAIPVRCVRPYTAHGFPST